VFSGWSVPKCYKGQRRSFAVEFRAPAGQDMSLDAEELNRGTEASDLLSAG
jgi:hypothetical protein